MLPFSELSRKQSDSLKAIANYLLIETEQSLFAAQKAIRDYKTSIKLRTQVLQVLLERSEIETGVVDADMHVDAEGDVDVESQ